MPWFHVQLMHAIFASLPSGINEKNVPPPKKKIKNVTKTFVNVEKTLLV